MKTKWLIYSVMGLLFFGMDLSFLGEAIVQKYTQSQSWILWGIVALVITNSGLCLLGQAVIEKIKITSK
ncbi:MAG: hypothetical protein HN443_08765 [Flavobacteriaceae bacterium]|jgi:hypothetical protein|nr:hypothetical protein [Flavobacteriaceae bacterium]